MIFFNQSQPKSKKTIIRKDISEAYGIIEKLKDRELAKQLLENFLDIETNNNEVKNFYIECDNADNMTENLDLHLEKLFVENINEYLDCFYFPKHYHGSHFSLLITNDETVLEKYRFAINYDEFVMLCGFDSYDREQITINKDYIGKFGVDTFEYFIKILVDELVSATMDIVGDDYSLDTYMEGWLENKEFHYFKTPLRYRDELEDNYYLENFGEDGFDNYKIKRLVENVGETNIYKLGELLNINILEIENNENPDINWEMRNGLLRYYDKKSCKRLYVKPEFLEKLKLDRNVDFWVTTKLDRNHYIEYYAGGIINYEDNHDDRDYDDSVGAETYGYRSMKEMAFHEAFEGDIDAWNHYNQ